MTKATCMHFSFEASADTFGELDEIYESHSKVMVPGMVTILMNLRGRRDKNHHDF
jgi:hypothetical protein